MAKIYTRTGDRGTTSLVSGERVPKYDVRLEAYGTLDELSAFVGYLYDSVSVYDAGSQEMRRRADELLTVLDRLMVVQAVLASTDPGLVRLPRIGDADIAALEEAIDAMNERLPKVFRFVLPCGHPLVSLAHVCRTVCRRSERAVLRVAKDAEVPEEVLRYINRLSDYLFMFGRFAAQETGAREILWEPGRPAAR